MCCCGYVAAMALFWVLCDADQLLGLWICMYGCGAAFNGHGLGYDDVVP